jgi:hypothetical protein
MWDKAKLSELSPHNAQVTAAYVGGGSAGEAVEVRCTYSMRASGCGTKIECESVYKVDVEGGMIVTNSCEVSPFLPPLPRIGLQLAVNPQLRRLIYFGRGPFENYPDRCSGARLGLYESHVDETFVPYIVPCENGLRTDVRFVALVTEAGKGLLVSAAPSEVFCFGARRCTAHHLHAATHACDVQLGEHVTVNLDYKHMPCGGNDSWFVTPRRTTLDPRNPLSECPKSTTRNPASCGVLIAHLHLHTHTHTHKHTHTQEPCPLARIPHKARKLHLLSAIATHHISRSMK